LSKEYRIKGLKAEKEYVAKK